MPKRHRKAVAMPVVHAFDVRPLARIVELFGGNSIVGPRLGCTESAVRHWVAGRRPLSSRRAALLRRMLSDLGGELPSLVAWLRELEERERQREAKVRGMYRARFLDRLPATGNMPGLTREQRAERRERDRLISRRIRGGEAAEDLAAEFGVEVHTIEAWAERGGGVV